MYVLKAGLRQLARDEVDMVFSAAAAAAALSSQSPEPHMFAPSFSRTGQYPSPVTPPVRLSEWDRITPASGLDALTIEEAEAARRELVGTIPFRYQSIHLSKWFL